MLGRTQGPEQNMRIEQQAHYRPSNASRISDGKGASKSVGTFSRPAKIPRRRFLRLAGPSGPSLASGVPDLAMMISSHAAACSTRRMHTLKRGIGCQVDAVGADCATLNPKLKPVLSRDFCGNPSRTVLRR